MEQRGEICRYEWLRYFAIQSKNVKPSSHKKRKKNIHMPLMFHSKITFIYMPLIELCIYLYIYNKFDHPSIFQLFSPSYFIDLPLLHPAPIFFGPPRRHALERAILLRLLRADHHLLRLSSLPGVVFFGHLRALLGSWHIDRWIETERERERYIYIRIYIYM